MTEHPWRDEETLRKLYHQEKLSTLSIGEKLGCDHTTVLRWMKKLNISRRDAQAAAHKRSGFDSDDYEYDYTDATDLEYLYHEKDLTLREMEGMLGVHNRTIRTWMSRYGIMRESKSDKRRSPVASFYTDNGGYERWAASGRGYQDIVRVHRLLAIADGGDPHRVFSGDYHVHHKNGCRFDNRPTNIELVTRREHGRRHLKIDPDVRRGMAERYHHTDDSSYDIAEDHDIAPATVLSIYSEFYPREKDR